MSDVAQENAPLLNAIGLKKYYPECLLKHSK